MAESILSCDGCITACIGCGACAVVCPDGAISVRCQPDGTLQAVSSSSPCTSECGACVSVCPFTPEDLGRPPSAYQVTEGSREHADIGSHAECYVGWAARESDRVAAASGGLATRLAAHLLSSGRVSRLFAVGPCDPSESGELFAFREFRASDAVVEGARGSAYYALAAEDALRTMAEAPGRSAITALPCVAHAIRRCEKRLGLEGERRPFIIGLVCGQVKSRLFAEYAAAKAGVPVPPSEVRFRVAREGQPATRFEVRARSGGSEGTTEWIRLARAWQSGAFTPGACWECSDTFALAADAVFMDAWLPEYTPDWRGTNLAVARTTEADEVFSECARDGASSLETIPADRVAESQIALARRKLEGSRYRAALAGRIDPAPDTQLPPETAKRYEKMWAISEEAGSRWKDDPRSGTFDRWLRREWRYDSAWRTTATRMRRVLGRLRP